MSPGISAPIQIRLAATMVANSVGTRSKISALFCPLQPPPPIPHTMLIYFKIWAQSLSTGVRLILPNALSSNINIVRGKGAIILLWGDLLRRPVKERETKFGAVFRYTPTHFGNDCLK